MSDEAEVTATETAPETNTQETVEQTPAPDTEIPQSGDGDSPPAPEEAQTGEEETEAQKDDGPVFTPELLQRAGKFGYDKYDVEALFDSPEKLERALSRLELHSPRQETAKPEAVKPAELPKFELKFSDEFDPEARKTLETMHQHYGGLVTEMQSKVDTLLEFVNKQQVRETSERLDKLFAGLPAEYEAIKTGKSMQNKVVMEMAVMEEAYRSRGMQMPEEGELFRRALAHIADVDPKKAARAEVTAQLVKGKNRLQVRPKSKSPADGGLSREEIAIRNAEAFMREHEGK